MELIIQIIAFNAVFYMAGALGEGAVFSIKGLLSCLLLTNYFVISHSVVYILSPYINILSCGHQCHKQFDTRFLKP